ncbi:hypothetical protein GLOIN_2v1499883 [Rhizophagus clarus]|uniref:Uncharacterized protein n=1 Tax=Rhizophagus clarus TaxID=94130 RepID=A0A8H3LW53_9GLOM|nr:hypothetical protein GLOIN_2v1499883 [Rhizophagus clarus]
MSTKVNNATLQNNSDNKNESSTPIGGPLNKLIGKQAAQFEEFGKRLQESHKEYESELKNFDDENYRKKIDTQANLINSLRARIEELENDTLEKDQHIKKLRQEIVDFPLSNNSKDSFLKDYEDMMEHSNWNNLSLNSSNNNNATLNSRVQEIDTLYGRSVKLRQYKFLKSSYSINELIEYTKTDNFNSLNKKSKRYINFHVKNMLLQEFQKPIVILSQDLDEYIKRDILPRLPDGHGDYMMCEDDSDWFDTLKLFI